MEGKHLLSSPTPMSQKRQVRWGAGVAEATQPPWWSPGSRRGGFWGSLERGWLVRGSFSMEERGPGGSSNFWSCLHTSWNRELTASCPPVLNWPTVTWWKVLPAWAVPLPSSPIQGSLYSVLYPTRDLLSPPWLCEVTLGPQGGLGRQDPGPLQPAKAGSDLAPVWCLQS